MKYLLAILTGLVLTLCVFVGGTVFALVYLSAEPVPVQKPAVESAMVLPNDAVNVDTTQQNVERSESQPAPEPSPYDGAIEPALHIDATEPLPPEIDNISTASITDPEISEPAALSDEHVNWCSNRYRSYRPDDNSYTPYSGGSRECISPFLGEATAPLTASDEDNIIEASAAEPPDDIDEDDASTGYLSPQHVESCYSRYRSYRPDDNTYQPYGGGPRRQCR